MKFDIINSKVGDKFIAANGEILTVEVNDGSLIMPIRTDKGMWHQSNGRSMRSDSFDIVGNAEVAKATSPALKIEAGKYYKAKDGRRCFVYGAKIDDKTMKPTGIWFGIVENYGEETWHKDGVPTKGSAITSLVAEWKEPESTWAAYLKRPDGTILIINENTKELVVARVRRNWSEYKLIAVRNESVTEGEGLEQAL